MRSLHTLTILTLLLVLSACSSENTKQANQQTIEKVSFHKTKNEPNLNGT